MSGSTFTKRIDGTTNHDSADGFLYSNYSDGSTKLTGIDGASNTAYTREMAEFDATGYWVWSEGGIEWILWGDGEEIEL